MEFMCGAKYVGWQVNRFMMKASRYISLASSILMHSQMSLILLGKEKIVKKLR